MVLTKQQLDINKLLSDTIKKNKPSIRETSIKQYTNQLRKFLEKINKSPDDINKNSTELLKEFNKLDDLSDNTKKNILISLMVFANDDAKKDYEPVLNKYNNAYFKKMSEGYNDSQKDKQNISFNDLIKVLEDYKKKANDIIKDKKEQITNKEHDTLTAYILLELYLNQAPLRNDYKDVLISNSPRVSKKETDDKDNNYYVVSTGTFVINDYKTSGSNGSIIFNVNSDLKKFIKKYISYSPDVKYLFYNQNMEPYSSSAFTNKINKIFKDAIGVPLSTTMIRHIYLTNKYGDLKKEMYKDAKMMGHSTDTQQGIYVK
jgi:integrase